MKAKRLGQAKTTAFVATANADRARTFYRDVLGLTLLSEDSFALVFDSYRVTLRIQKVEQLQPQPFTTLGWAVPDINSAVSALAKYDVSFERYAFLKQNKSGIWQSPSGAKVAWFKDPDGNVLSLTEHPR